MTKYKEIQIRAEAVEKILDEMCDHLKYAKIGKGEEEHQIYSQTIKTVHSFILDNPHFFIGGFEK